MKKTILITIAALFTVNVWGQNFIQKTSTNPGTIDFRHDGSLTIKSLAVTNVLTQYSKQSGFTQRRLTFNTNEGDKAYIYYYDQTAATFHTINIGGSNSLSSGLTILGNGNVGIGYSNPLVKLHVGGATTIDGSLVTAILGDDYNRWTYFGGTKGGRIRGSNEGYLIIESNPNGTGNKRLYLGNTENVSIARGGGNVGIGISSPTSKLHLVQDNENFDSGIKIVGSTSGISGRIWMGNEKLHIDNATAGTGTGFTLDKNGKIGIGTSNPEAKLEVLKTGTIGSKWNPSASYLKLTDGNYSLIADGNEIYTNHSLHLGCGDGQSIIFRKVNSTGYSNLMIIKSDGNVGIGTTNPGTYKLAVEGKIGAHEIVVTTEGWADFVFEDDYNLMPIKEVENFIEENGHLPDVPNAEQVKEEGVSLGEMDKILLQKIEELTLYVIELKKENEELNQKVEAILNK